MKINSKIVRNFPRADGAQIEALCSFGVSTICEAQGGTGLMAPYLRPIYHGTTIAGSGITVCCECGDNLMLHAAVDLCQRGDVLVVSTTSDSDHGMFGALLGICSQARGVRALVIDAGVRDVSDLIAMQFPVWAKVISAKSTTKNGPGSVNMPIMCAGIRVQPGDVVIADEDGVVVVSTQSVQSVVRAARERYEHEQRLRERLNRGESTLDILRLRSRLPGI